jgi:hypothetical protein
MVGHCERVGEQYVFVQVKGNRRVDQITSDSFESVKGVAARRSNLEDSFNSVHEEVACV